MAAAWSATAALTSVYAPATPAAVATRQLRLGAADGDPPPGPVADDPAEVFARAARHGDAHVVKLADAVLEAYATTGDDRLLAAAGYAARLI